MLFGLLKKEVEANHIHGIHVARKAPQISHFGFADDNLLFSRVNSKEVDCIKDILTKY